MGPAREQVGTLVTGLLGQKIRALRKKRGYSLDRLAQLTGSSKSWIWELESREVLRPSGEKVAQIAAALGVTSDYLLGVSSELPGDEVVDDIFFRQFQRLDPLTKRRLRDLVAQWSKD